MTIKMSQSNAESTRDTASIGNTDSEPHVKIEDLATVEGAKEASCVDHYFANENTMGARDKIVYWSKGEMKQFGGSATPAEEATGDIFSFSMSTSTAQMTQLIEENRELRKQVANVKTTMAIQQATISQLNANVAMRNLTSQTSKLTMRDSGSQDRSGQAEDSVISDWLKSQIAKQVRAELEHVREGLEKATAKHVEEWMKVNFRDMLTNYSAITKAGNNDADEKVNVDTLEGAKGEV
jgi:hypothetical protein